MIPIEVEIKCAITPENISHITDFIEKDTSFIESSEKIDWYYGDKTTGQVKFRIREENGKSTITQKKRNTTPQGIEQNEELEFEVSSGENFRAFCESQGQVFLYQKIKSVRKYQYKNMLIEWVQLPPLGEFLEVEVVTTREGSKKAGEDIMQLFQDLDIVGNIEKRPYAVLLKEKGVF